MKTGLIETLLSDRNAGLQTDGKRLYFRQRRVAFRTIAVDACDLHEAVESGPLVRDALPPPDRSSNRSVREFAHESSRRFLHFWYEVFNVAVARALCGRGCEIFLQDFLRPTAFLDIGVPADNAHSSVPPALHEKILAEYEHSRKIETACNIRYLSGYLEGISSDVAARLGPYRRLWELRSQRRMLLDETRRINRAFREELLGRNLERDLFEALGRALLEIMDGTIRAGGERRIAADDVRNLVHKRRAGNLASLSVDEIAQIMRRPEALDPPPALKAAYDAMTLPGRLADLGRSAATLCSLLHRCELTIARLNHAQRRLGLPVKNEGLIRRRKRHLEAFEQKLTALAEFRKPEREGRILGRLAHLRKVSQPGKLVRETLLDDISKAGMEGNHVRSLTETLIRLRRTDEEIRGIYDREKSEPPENTRFRDERYPGSEELILPAGLEVGNPFHESAILNHARDLLLRRLRPVRRSSAFYSLIPGDRHGAMTVNPVMRLWKDRPNPRDASLPRLALQEINTRETVDCLVSLARLADRNLEARELRREKILREKRGQETLSNLLFLLLPGSAYPLREVHRLDFPDFRGRVIGESRSPAELGVPPEEDAVLTGAWYQKYNHALYCSVGADNARLLKTVHTGGRFPGCAAFFFALGQFVHDCLPDNLVYYRTTEKTFRECVEELYRMEDRIRLNRGERSGRRRADNSRPAVRFMFAVHYSQSLMEALTGAAQTHFRHAPMELWFHRHLELPTLRHSDKSVFRKIHRQAAEIIAAA